MTPHIFIFVLLSMCFERPEGKVFKYPPWALRKHYAVSADSSFLKHMIRKPGFNETSYVINDFVNYVESGIIDHLRNGTSRTPDQQFDVCTTTNKMYKNSIKIVFGIRHLPVPENDCVTDVVGTKLFSNRPSRFTDELIWNAVMDRVRLVEKEKEELLSKTLFRWKDAKRVLANWSNPVVRSNSMWTRPDKVCRWTVAGHIRVGKTWFSSIIFTNQPLSYMLPMFGRQFVSEFLYVDPKGKKTRSLMQRFPTYLNETANGPFQNATLHFYRDEGEAKQSVFYPVYAEDNPAVQDAVSKADIPIQQTADALSPSSILILFLPVLLNLVPLELFSPAEKKVLLLYMVLSDFLTVVPLLIKGAELVVISSQRFRSIATRIHGGMSGARGPSAGGELWVAECWVRNDPLLPGLFFVLSALFMLAFGIGLEFLARRYIQKKLKHNLELTQLYNRVRTGESHIR